MKNTVKGMRVGALIRSASRASSVRPITEVMEVAFSSVSHRLPRPGMASRQACGSSILRNTCALDMP